MRIILSIIVMALATQAAADQVREQVQCYANLSQYLFTVDMREKNNAWETKRQRHLALAVTEGRKIYLDRSDEFGVDFYLGGFVERVYQDQVAKLSCDDPTNYSSSCVKWVSLDPIVLSKIGLKFYEQENCETLLK